MQRRGFTIVELIIAISVGVIITFVAIPRYNVYIRQQDFVAGGQSMVACLQRAQQAAATGLQAPTPGGSATGPTRYALVEVTQPASTHLVTCSMSTFPSSKTPTTDLTDILTGSLTNGNSRMVLANMFVTQLGSSNPSPQRIVFGSIEKGVQLGYSSGGTVVNSANSSNPPAGEGFPLSIELLSNDTSLCGVITLGQFGGPITFATKPSCP